MDKRLFIDTLRIRLSGLPQDDIERSIEFYSEMIDDKIDEGLSEEEAIFQIGAIDDIVSQIMADIPFSKLVREKVKPKRALKGLEITLLILGSPIWLSILIAVLALIISAYAVIWSLVISLWAAELGVIGCSIGGVLSTAIFVAQGNSWTAICMLGAGLVAMGVGILLFFGCKLTTKGVLILTKKILISIKSCFIKKENVK